MRRSFERFLLTAVGAAALLASASAPAADHGDAPGIASDRGADINDCYTFLDPNDNTKVVLGFTVHGFIVPGEGVNFGVFDPGIRYRFNLETTGDFIADQFINITFSRKTSTAAQTATVVFSDGPTFTAQVTNPSLAATSPSPIVTTDSTGIGFFAGEVDDPFFFDIPAFSRFIASVRAGAPDVTTFNRGRDSFAGYNTLAMAVRVPATLIRHGANSLGVNCVTQRQTETNNKNGGITRKGVWHQVDRMGNPAVNVVLIPFEKKDSHNASTPKDDVDGKFVADIRGTMNLLGTPAGNQDLLLSVIQAKGDYLRLDLTKANTGTKGGTNAGAGFPNGRRLTDDVVDTELSILSAGGITEGDNVDASDVAPRDTFPFFGPAQQPREPGVVDDNTRS